jgi:putative SOS response-associated peptidase YedK
VDKNGQVVPPQLQDKRSVVPIERADWHVWLTGDKQAAAALMRLPAAEVFAHGPVGPSI